MKQTEKQGKGTSLIPQMAQIPEIAPFPSNLVVF